MNSLKEIYWVLGGLSGDQARRLVRKSRQSWKRYRTQQPPYLVRRVLELDAAGLMPCCAGDFIGEFRFVRGKLVDLATNYEYTAGEIRAWWWRQQELEIYRAARQKDYSDKNLIQIQRRLIK